MLHYFEKKDFYKKKAYSLFLILITGFALCAQKNGGADRSSIRKFFNERTYYEDTAIHILYAHNCKTPYFFAFKLLNKTKISTEADSIIKVFKPDSFPSANKRQPWLKVHGNIYYSFDYRSAIDTPFNEKNVQQHTVQTYLDVTLKNTYPFRIYLTNRIGNSQWFKNFTDINLQFDPYQFRNNVRQILLQRLNDKLALDSLTFWKNKIDSLENVLTTAKAKLPNKDYLQKEVEKREMILLDKMNRLRNIDTVIAKMGFPNYPKDLKNNIREKVQDTITNIAGKEQNNSKVYDLYKANEEELNNRRQQIDSLEDEVKNYYVKYELEKERLQKYKQELRELIQNDNSLERLKENLQKLNLSDTILPKGYKTLLSIRSLSLGRSVVDYSELTVKNLSIKGLQAEFNPSYYVAGAIGTVDYAFRDYIVSNTGPKQYVGIVRTGFGRRDRSNIIVSYYVGRKQLYNASTTDNTSIQSTSNIQGISLEGNYRIFSGTIASVEIAKSSMPYYDVKNNKSFSNQSTLAYSFKINSIVGSTKTRVQGSFKHFGEGFQSFSVFNTGTKQNAWFVRVDQPLFKNKLLITASVKKNEYSNPLIEYSNQTNTIFKSIQGTLRIPKWPVIFVGYYPSSQLTKLAKDQYVENLFYNLVASVNHYYKLNKTTTNSSLTYTQFYNKANDSGFVYFNSKNLQLLQSFFTTNYTLQLTTSISSNVDYNIYSIGGSMQYQFNRILSAGGGLKYNKQTFYNINQLGYSTNISLKFKRVGDIQLFAEKNYIPGTDKKLVENIVGRVTFFKTF